MSSKLHSRRSSKTMILRSWRPCQAAFCALPRWRQQSGTESRKSKTSVPAMAVSAWPAPPLSFGSRCAAGQAIHLRELYLTSRARAHLPRAPAAAQPTFSQPSHASFALYSPREWTALRGFEGFRKASTTQTASAMRDAFHGSAKLAGSVSRAALY